MSAVLGWISAHWIQLMKLIAVIGAGIAVGWGVYSLIQATGRPEVQATYAIMAQMFPLMIQMFTMMFIFQLFGMFREFIGGFLTARSEK